MTPLHRLGQLRILAVVTVDDAENAAPLARALLAGGVRAIEVALRTPVALEALRVMRATAPELILGAGTVLDGSTLDAARAAGADFALAPGLDATTVRQAAAVDFPFVPGVATASDIQAAIGLGCRLLKVFPVEPLGGMQGLRLLAAPFLHLGVRFLPLGGINAAALPAYLAEPAIAAVGGSWLAPRELIYRQDWKAVEKLAAEAVRLVADSSLP